MFINIYYNPFKGSNVHLKYNDTIQRQHEGGYILLLLIII